MNSSNQDPEAGFPTLNSNSSQASLRVPKETNTMKRKKSLVRPERSKSTRRNYLIAESGLRNRVNQADGPVVTVKPPPKEAQPDSGPELGWWVVTSRVFTCCLPPFFLKHVLRKDDPYVQQAFREKLALCLIIFILMFAVGFLTFGFTRVVCGVPPPRFKYSELSGKKEVFAIRGKAYQASSIHLSGVGGKDLSPLFPPTSDCSQFFSSSPIPCNITGSSYPCQVAKDISNYKYVSEIYMNWDDISGGKLDGKADAKVVVYNGEILDISTYSQFQDILGKDTYDLVSQFIGHDISLPMKNAGKVQQARCMVELFQVAFVERSTIGCVVTDIVLYVSLAFIIGVVVIKFALAVFFTYAIGWRLGKQDKVTKTDPKSDNRITFVPSSEAEEDPLSSAREYQREYMRNDPSARPPSSISDIGNLALTNFNEISALTDPLNDPNLMHTLIMVPCYSENYDSLKLTFDSIAETDYPSTHKTIFVVADGIIQGAENDKPTHQYVIDMMEIDKRFKTEDPKNGGEPPSFSYVAIADGSNRKNYAKVYAGWYRYDANKPAPKKNNKDDTSIDDEKVRLDRTGTLRTLRNRKRGRIPIILVVKVGNMEEQITKAAKPGNRGKRDSQIVLMNFLTKVIFDERMTSLEFEMFFKLWTITGVHPDKYESILMVDADTKIYPSSLTRMIDVMKKDPDVIGLCGETRVSNKWQSWVTMIQVFEYYISHHLSKSFESVFGCVTCLPGCFSMYRIKTSVGKNGYCVPILANPDIVEEYAEYVVDTLHKKNLLLLGEDRFLSTLMLRTFTKRKMLFVPSAICTTTVPDTFKVLLSQRRRWINSTIHNLLELIQVRELCGAFCFSMQFVIFMELVGTVVLPAAISFTMYIIVLSFVSANPPIIPLALLAAILGLPALLIVLTAHRAVYVFWMLVYLLALPVWNLVLPLYAFWNMDDFTWGATRKTEGDSKDEDHGRRRGEFDGTDIAMKTWIEWMDERKGGLLKLAKYGNGYGSGAYQSELGVNDSSSSRSSSRSFASSSGSNYNDAPKVSFVPFPIRSLTNAASSPLIYETRENQTYSHNPQQPRMVHTPPPPTQQYSHLSITPQRNIQQQQGSSSSAHSLSSVPLPQFYTQNYLQQPQQQQQQQRTPPPPNVQQIREELWRKR